MVVVLTVLTEHHPQVTFRGDEHRVEAFAPAAAYPPLGMCNSRLIGGGALAAMRRPWRRRSA
jgi:hypothetical protein